MDQSKPLLVAIVEDEAPWRTGARTSSHGRGIRALLESAEAHIDASPEPTCIVVDVQLPGTAGIHLQERLRVAGSAPPIIVTTFRHEMVIQERAQQTAAPRFSGSQSTVTR